MHLRNEPLPERQGFCVRVVDSKNSHALVEPEEHDVSQGVPERRESLAIEVDIDDILILLRRIFGILDGAIGPPVEPFWMLLYPGVIRRTLNGEIQRDLQPLLTRCRHQPGEILKATQLR